MTSDSCDSAQWGGLWVGILGTWTPGSLFLEKGRWMLGDWNGSLASFTGWG